MFKYDSRLAIVVFGAGFSLRIYGLGGMLSFVFGKRVKTFFWGS